MPSAEAGGSSTASGSRSWSISASFICAPTQSKRCFPAIGPGVMFHQLRQNFVVVTTKPVVGTKNHHQMLGGILRLQGNLAGAVCKRSKTPQNGLVVGLY